MGASFNRPPLFFALTILAILAACEDSKDDSAKGGDQGGGAQVYDPSVTSGGGATAGVDGEGTSDAGGETDHDVADSQGDSDVELYVIYGYGFVENATPGQVKMAKKLNDGDWTYASGSDNVSDTEYWGFTAIDSNDYVTSLWYVVAWDTERLSRYDGSSWSYLGSLNNGTPVDNNVTNLAFDSNDTLYFIWNDVDIEEPYNHITLTPTGELFTVDYTDGELLVDRNDVVHTVLVDAEAPLEVRYTSSALSWASPTVVSNANCTTSATAPTLCKDENNYLHLAYICTAGVTSSIRYLKRNPTTGTWSSEETIDSGSSLSVPQMVTDPDNKQHIIYKKSSSIYYANNTSGTFSTPDGSTGAGGTTQFIGADTQGNIHIVYGVGNVSMVSKARGSSSWSAAESVDDSGNIDYLIGFEIKGMPGRSNR